MTKKFLGFIALLVICGSIVLLKKRGDQYISSKSDLGNSSIANSARLENKTFDYSDVKESLTSHKEARLDSGSVMYKNPSELKHEISDFLASSEAKRARMLTEVRSGPSMIYLLAIEPPSQVEIRLIRDKLSEIQKAVEDWARLDRQRAGSREEFDQWVGIQLKRYDSFNVGGKKALAITIHDDPAKPTVGFTFSTHDYEKEIERFTNGTTDFEFENLVSYGRNDGQILERFRKLIVQD